METLKELLQKPERLAPGHRTCRGCAIPIIVRAILRATDKPVVVANATGCLEVTTTLYPQTSWQVPYIHNAFENAPATISGVIAAYEYLKERGRVPQEIKFVVFAGDGATFDIGLQSLSGAWERGDDFLYVCYNNEAYGNTGNQRSAATPIGAFTTTTPAGKLEPRKDIMAIGLAHDIPYLAQAAIHDWADLHKKAQKAFNIKGPTFLHILSPCVVGWKYDSNLTVELSRLAADTCYWPLYEIENNVYKLNYQPKEKLPLEEFLKPQKRFKHLLKEENKEMLERLKKEVDERWQELLEKVK